MHCLLLSNILSDIKMLFKYYFNKIFTTQVVTLLFLVLLITPLWCVFIHKTVCIPCLLLYSGYSSPLKFLSDHGCKQSHKLLLSERHSLYNEMYIYLASNLLMHFLAVKHSSWTSLPLVFLYVSHWFLFIHLCDLKLLRIWIYELFSLKISQTFISYLAYSISQGWPSSFSVSPDVSHHFYTFGPSEWE